LNHMLLNSNAMGKGFRFDYLANIFLLIRFINPGPS